MKLRIKGNSLRLRITRSEIEKLFSDGRIEETMWFGPGDSARLTYGLEHSAGAMAPTIRYNPPALTVILPTEDAQRWAATDQVGIYAAIDLDSRGSLDIIVEKDFACLHGTAAENEDAFPNPRASD
jgi:Family of unknown function (DUF7009)